ncbi:unnamed protein product [Trifolium pratense]|uniref:Uncharacterized protein n=1 Tax=Trifolium pratense TaxID=57577 RepID=A0ACB0LBJ5_TRIPR|nr:unnamed protein product [Trifolium pratense]
MRKLLLASSLYAFSSFSHNPTLGVRGLKGFDSNDPDCVMPKGLIGLLRWRFIRNYQTVPYTNRTRFISIPISVERIAGERYFEEQKQSFDIMPSTHPVTVRVTDILNHIIHALHNEKNKMSSASSNYSVWLHLTRSLPPSMSHLDGLNWEVLVVNEPEDIFTGCYAGGKIVTTTASVYHGSDAYLATVLAHEVGHIVARHHAEKETRSTWVYFIHDMLNRFVTIDFAQRVLPLVQLLPFNRRLEMEADYIGLLLMAAAGYDPRCAPIIYDEFDKYEELKESRNKFKLGGFLSSHPPGRKRAQALDRPRIMEEALVLYNNVKAKRGDES